MSRSNKPTPEEIIRSRLGTLTALNNLVERCNEALDRRHVLMAKMMVKEDKEEDHYLILAALQDSIDRQERDRASYQQRIATAELDLRVQTALREFFDLGKFETVALLQHLDNLRRDHQ